MVESIYGYDKNKQNNKLKNIHMKIPKNIKQIGNISGELVVYMEDYVRTYLQQFSECDFAELSSAILVGAYQKSEEEQNLFIRGAIRTECLMQGKELLFSEAIWGGVYEKMQQFFPDEEIVGWFCGGLNLPPCDMESMKQIHLDNFPGKEKVLFFYDPLDKEECFYRFEQNCLAVQQGYYVYYEKNEAMQEYMLSCPFHDKSEKKISEVLASDAQKAPTIETEETVKENYVYPKKEEKKKKTVFRLAYASLTLMIMVALAVAASIKKEGGEEIKPSFTEEPKQEDSAMTWITSAPEVPSKGNAEKEGIVVPTEPILTPKEEDKQTEIKPEKKEEEESDKGKEDTASITPKQTKIKDFKTYTVQVGDTLASISRKTYGNANRIKDIYALNNMDNEDYIYVGQKLLLPEE